MDPMVTIVSGEVAIRSGVGLVGAELEWRQK